MKGADSFARRKVSAVGYANAEPHKRGFVSKKESMTRGKWKKGEDHFNN
jgi:hypothetical protein